IIQRYSMSEDSIKTVKDFAVLSFVSSTWSKGLTKRVKDIVDRVALTFEENGKIKRKAPSQIVDEEMMEPGSEEETERVIEATNSVDEHSGNERERTPKRQDRPPIKIFNVLGY